MFSVEGNFRMSGRLGLVFSAFEYCRIPCEFICQDMRVSDPNPAPSLVQRLSMPPIGKFPDDRPTALAVFKLLLGRMVLGLSVVVVVGSSPDFFTDH